MGLRITCPNEAISKPPRVILELTCDGDHGLLPVLECFVHEDGTIEQLRFLLTVHEARRVVLIAHEGCAYYTERIHVSPLQLETQQHDDLVKAIRRVRRFGLDIDVLAFFARRHGEALTFERVEG